MQTTYQVGLTQAINQDSPTLTGKLTKVYTSTFFMPTYAFFNMKELFSFMLQFHIAVEIYYGMIEWSN